MKPAVATERGYPGPGVVATMKIQIREDFPANPVCPHCGKDIAELAARKVVAEWASAGCYIDGVPVLRFRYAPRSVERLTHDEGAPSKVRRGFYPLLAVPYILKNTVAADRRERVIEQEVARGTNVIFANPELVKTYAGPAGQIVGESSPDQFSRLACRRAQLPARPRRAHKGAASRNGRCCSRPR